MTYRSWLIVPGDSEEELGDAIGTGADAVVVDLADSISPYSRGTARELAGEWLAVHRRNILEQRAMSRWVRINALDSGLWRDDLIAVIGAGPDGIVLPRAAGPEAVRQLAAEIYELEQRHHIPANSVAILPVAGETPLSALSIVEYCHAPHQRLAGLTWGADSLSSALGASRCRHEDGAWTDTNRFVRVQTLLAAHACGVMAIEAAPMEAGSDKEMASIARIARSDGFTGMLAIDPAQVPAINEAFTPSAEEVEEAQAIVSAFEAHPDLAAARIDGRMVDRSKLPIAERTLELGEHKEARGRRVPILRPA